VSTFVNEPSTVDPDAYTVRRSITIAAAADKVWAAITEAELLARWFPQTVDLPAMAVGATGTFAFEGHGNVHVVIEELDPPHMIAYRWGNESGEPPAVGSGASTVFRFTLDPVDGGTRLTVVESGFDTLKDPSARMEDNRGGWDWELNELVAYLEGAA
jgi:uncharacterized protein YndB with AHSA1/START domain